MWWKWPEKKNFTRAAYELNVTQSALSRQIASLEEELDTKLFVRKARTVELTPEGKAFLQHAVTILKDVEIAHQSVLDFKGLLRGTIRMGIISSLGTMQYDQMLYTFYKNHPGIQFYIEEGGTYALLQKLQDRDLDLALLVRPTEKAYSDIAFYPLLTDRYVLVLPKNHKLAGKKKVYIRELSAERFVLHPPTEQIRCLISEACQAAGFAPQIVCECNHSPTQLTLISAGMCIGIFPKEKVRNIAKKKDLAIVNLADDIEKEIGLAVLKKGQPTPAVQLFSDFIVRWVKELPARKAAESER